MFGPCEIAQGYSEEEEKIVKKLADTDDRELVKKVHSFFLLR